MKLWHDDVRPAPEGFVWARTNTEAKGVLATGTVTEASLDHDLGLEGVEPAEYEALSPEHAHEVFLAARGGETGVELCRWMVESDHIPALVRIHSWNPAGAGQMAAILSPHTHVSIEPFQGAR